MQFTADHRQNPECTHSGGKPPCANMAKTCRIDGCDRTTEKGGDGLCGLHYQRVMPWHQDFKPITWHGKQYWPRQWAEEVGIPLATVRNRLRAGWSLERIASTPVRKWTRKNA